MSYNIEMQYYDGSEYQVLNPKTNLNQISDWTNSIYNKSEIDSKVSALDNKIKQLEVFKNGFNYNKINTVKLNQTLTGGYNISGTQYGTNVIIIQENSYLTYQDIAVLVSGSVSWTNTGSQLEFTSQIKMTGSTRGQYFYVDSNDISKNGSVNFNNDIVLKDYNFSGVGTYYNIMDSNDLRNPNYYSIPGFENNFLNRNLNTNITNSLQMQPILNFTGVSYTPSDKVTVRYNLTFDIYTRTNPWWSEI